MLTPPSVWINPPAECVCDALGNDGALDGDVRRVAAADGKCFIQPPGNGKMIENHVMAVGDGDGVVVVAIEAHADAEEPGDGVVGAGVGQAIAVNRDAAARRGLAGNGDVVGHGNHVADADDAADVKDHRAIGRGRAGAERAGAGVVGVRDVIDRAAAPAGGKPAETFRAGKSRQLGRCRRTQGRNQNQPVKKCFHVEKTMAPGNFAQVVERETYHIRQQKPSDKNMSVSNVQLHGSCNR